MRIAAACVVLCAVSVQAQTVSLTPISSGAMKKMGGYRPQRLKLGSEKPATIKKAPADLSAPVYGVLAIGPDTGKPGAPVYHVIVDEPEGKPARLFVDANGNGDLTDDPATEWTAKTTTADGKEHTQYNGGATVELRAGDAKLPAHLGMYRFDKNDESRPQLKDVLLYYADYAYEGEVSLGDKKYKAMLTDDMATGDFRGKKGKEGEKSDVTLRIDVNQNGRFDARGESFDIREPFNIGGTTWEVGSVSPLGSEMQIVKSSKTVAEIATPPDHSVGKKITAFKAKDTEGKDVDFPGGFKGKIVMVDFWATWCHPCMDEVPGLVKVYKELHPKGFEILGVTLDQENALDKVREVTGEQGMTWRQVHDGKGWKAEIADLYVIRSIPAAFLVDGDTGQVLASGESLRGDALRGTIEKALNDKFKEQRN